MNRRKFILPSAAAAGGGLALGFNLPFGVSSAAAQAAAAGGAEINAWVFVKPNDTCVIRIARSEMGQGTITGLAQLVAEELECDWKKVATEQFTAGQNLARKRRSEEHTSELQSQSNLVCRLLLEKKKKHSIYREAAKNK